jgi:hypothetical protein
MEPTDIKRLMAGMRHEPKTPRQWEQAVAGAAAMDEDWEAVALPRFVGDSLIGTSPFYRAAYELRYHELLAAQRPAAS